MSLNEYKPLDLTKKPVQNDEDDHQRNEKQDEDPYEDDDNEQETNNEENKVKRSIAWFDSKRTYNVPVTLWNKIYDDKNNSIMKSQYTYYKNKICEDFDTHFECMLVLKKPRIGVKLITIQGYCKHDKCRKIKLVAPVTTLRNEDAPTFSVLYSSLTTNHTVPIIRQYRGVLRQEAKTRLKNCLPATFVRELVNEMDETLYKVHKKRTVPTDSVAQKMRSELMLSQDYHKDDIQDMIELQKETKDSPYIQKVISPYAVYIHSKEQYETLVLLHKRKKPGEEVIGRLDGTGNVAYVTPETSEHPLLYYPLVCSILLSDDDKHRTLFPITECINTQHGTSDLTSFLQDFNGKFLSYNSHILPLFDRIISDFSYANLHAVLHSFQSMRLQEYIFHCYKYAVNLEDFSRLSRLVKITLCATHLAKTKVSFVRGFFPAQSSIKKTTFEQKFVIEVLLSFITCKSYNLLKEIFRNLCIVLCSEFESEHVKAAKESIAKLTEKDMLMMTRDQCRSNFKYNVIVQEKIDELSEDESVYENTSILKLPIYRGSQFYLDLKYIFDNEMADKTEHSTIKNTFYKPQLLDDYMKQFGGILPLWNGITVPENVERYDNQPAERQMLVAKDVLDEMALQVGHSKVRVTRFVKLLREITVANAKRFRLKLGKNSRSNRVVKCKPKDNRVVKCKPKDNSKIAKKIYNYMKAKATKPPKRTYQSSFIESNISSIESTNAETSKRISTSSIQCLELSNQSNVSSNYSLRNKSHSLQDSSNSSLMQCFESSYQSDVSSKSKPRKNTNTNLDSSHSSNLSEKDLKSQSVGGAKESWNKNKSKKKRFSYHKRATIIAVKNGYQPLRQKGTMENKSKMKNSKKKRTISPKKTMVPPETTVTSTFPNGLQRDSTFYQQLVPHKFTVARIGDRKLSNEDYKALHEAKNVPINTMAYILQFVVPPGIVNLLDISEHVIAETQFYCNNVTNRICLLPILYESEWQCYVLDCKKSTCRKFSCAGPADLEFKRKLGFFITTYNADVKHHNKLEPIEFWKELDAVTDIHPAVESGIFIIYLVSLLVNKCELKTEDFNPSRLRGQLMSEVLQHSDDMFDVCAICGDANDPLGASVINWTNCSYLCDRWFHDNCIGMSLPSTVDYQCFLCKELNLENELSTIKC